MKPQLIGMKKRPSVPTLTASEASVSLHEELVAAIHGAFEVAVEIAVREVTELVGQATGDIYEEMRRENETLKQRLQRAEAMLEEGGGSTAGQTDQHHLKYNHKSQNPKVDNGVRGDTPAGHSRAHHSPPDPKDNHVSRSEELRSDGDVRTQLINDAASNLETEGDNGCAGPAFTKDVTEEIPPVCVVKVESNNQPCRDPAVQHHRSPPLPDSDEEFITEQVKQENPEKERDGSACCLDSIKGEDLSLECMSAVQSTMLEEWKPEEQNIHHQDPDTQLPCTRLAQAPPPNLTSGLTPSIDLPSLSSEFPNIFQLAEPAPIQEDSPQVFGVHVRTSRNPGHTIANLYTCKSCGQTFHLPSLLRRHHGQCQQKLQQRCQPPVVGSKRARLQLYPPGCSPFRCMECNREFNRMENLKTHFRIHTGERPYTCSVCSKCFRHSGALTRHFRIHTGEKPYICGQCGKSFRNCGGLKFHQRSHSK